MNDTDRFKIHADRAFETDRDGFAPVFETAWSSEERFCPCGTPLTAVDTTGECILCDQDSAAASSEAAWWSSDEVPF
jgi:hypothetical protein